MTTPEAVTQDWENVRTRKPLIPLPTPHITGMKLQGDVMIDSTPVEVHKVDLTYPAISGVNVVKATLHFKEKHPFRVGENILVSHLKRVPALLNGEWQVDDIDTYSITLRDKEIDDRGPLLQWYYEDLLDTDGEYSYANQQGAVTSRLTLNAVDRDSVVWVCTDISGWWTAPEPEFPEANKAYGDGSYDVGGRFLDRQLTLEGSILPPDPALAAPARDRLTESLNLVYQGAWLKAVERQPVLSSSVAITDVSRYEDILTVTIPGHSFRVGDVVRISNLFLRADGPYFSAAGASRTVVSTKPIVPGIPLGSRVLLDTESGNYALGDTIPQDTVVVGRPSDSQIILTKYLPNSLGGVSLMFSLDELCGTHTVFWADDDSIKINLPGADYDIPSDCHVTGSCLLGELTKASFVRLSGQPDISSETARGRQNFSIGLKAADPVKYLWSDTFDGREALSLPTKRTVNATSGRTERTVSGNDTFAKAVDLSRMNLTGDGAVVTSSNVGASKEPGEPDLSANEGGASIWFSYKPVENMLLTVTTDGSTFDTILGIMTGSTLSTLTEVDSDDDSGEGNASALFDVALQANETYWIVVDGYGGATGTVKLNLINTSVGEEDYREIRRTVVNAGNYPVGMMVEIGGPVAGPLWLSNYTTDKVTKVIGALGGVGSYTVLSKSIDNDYATLTLAEAHSITVGQRVFVSGVDATFNSQTITTTATGAANTNTVTVSSASGVSEGYAIRLSGSIPDGTVIIKVDGPVLTLSNSLEYDLADDEVYIDIPHIVTEIPTPYSFKYRKVLKRVSNVRSYSLTDDIVTITTKSPHGFEVGEKVTVSDVDPAINVYQAPILSVPTSKRFTYRNPRARTIVAASYLSTKGVMATDQCTIYTTTTHGYRVGETITITGAGRPYNVSGKSITDVNHAAKSVTFLIPSLLKQISAIAVYRKTLYTFLVSLTIPNHGLSDGKLDVVVQLGTAKIAPPALNKQSVTVNAFNQDTIRFEVSGFPKTIGREDFKKAFGVYPSDKGLTLKSRGGTWTSIAVPSSTRYVTTPDSGKVSKTGTVNNTSNIAETVRNGTVLVNSADSSVADGRVTTVADILTIDTRLRATTLNTSTNGRAKLDARTDWVTLAPGENIISTVDYGDLTAVGSVVIRYRSGWIS